MRLCPSSRRVRHDVGSPWLAAAAAVAVVAGATGLLATLPRRPGRPAGPTSPAPSTAPSTSPSPTAAPSPISSGAPTIPYVLDRRLFVDGEQVPGDDWWSVTPAGEAWIAVRGMPLTWWWGTGTEVHELPNGEDVNPKISPDGSYVAVVRSENGRGDPDRRRQRERAEPSRGRPPASAPSVGRRCHATAVRTDGIVVIRQGDQYLTCSENRTAGTSSGQMVYDPTSAGLVAGDVDPGPEDGGPAYLAEISDTGTLTKVRDLPGTTTDPQSERFLDGLDPARDNPAATSPPCRPCSCSGSRAGTPSRSTPRTVGTSRSAPTSGRTTTTGLGRVVDRAGAGPAGALQCGCRHAACWWRPTERRPPTGRSARGLTRRRPPAHPAGGLADVSGHGRRNRSQTRWLAISPGPRRTPLPRSHRSAHPAWSRFRQPRAPACPSPKRRSPWRAASTRPRAASPGGRPRPCRLAGLRVPSRHRVRRRRRCPGKQENVELDGPRGGERALHRHLVDHAAVRSDQQRHHCRPRRPPASARVRRRDPRRGRRRCRPSALGRPLPRHLRQRRAGLYLCERHGRLRCGQAEALGHLLAEHRVDVRQALQSAAP